MLGIEFTGLPRWILVAVLLIAMMVKAGYIASNFMHLRFERPAQVWIIAGNLVATVLAMFLYMSADALHVLLVAIPLVISGLVIFQLRRAARTSTGTAAPRPTASEFRG
jgi:cytochrome c oxidase subunit IV